MCINIIHQYNHIINIHLLFIIDIMCCMCIDNIHQYNHIINWDIIAINTPWELRSNRVGHGDEGNLWYERPKTTSYASLFLRSNAVAVILQNKKIDITSVNKNCF